MGEKFNEEEFLNFVKKQSELIRNQALDSGQISQIWKQYVNIAENVLPSMHKTPYTTSFVEATFGLQIALQAAFSNFRKESRVSWWVRLGDWFGAGKKFPDLEEPPFKRD